MTNIAQNTDNTDKDIEELNDKIAAWLKARTATTRRDLQRLISKHLVKPALGLLLMSFTGIGIIYVRRKFRYWFVIDTHPEYDRGLWQTLEFLLRMTLTTTKRLTQK